MDFFRNTGHTILLFILLVGASCASKKKLEPRGLQIAVMADIHLQDVYGNLADSKYPGIKNPKTGEYVLIRTMGGQLRSTRIFNENYFAFLAALDDVVKRKVKHILLPGDFSDDGQPLHIRGLKRILEDYSKNHGISFYLITGNHDVVRPFNHRDGKLDFLGEGGKRQPIMSQPQMYVSDTVTEHPVVISEDLQNLGYEEITNVLGDFGFFPKKSDLYWESPFSSYSYDNYDFENAKKQAALKNRSHLFPTNDIPLPDVSYLVEPVKGLWLLALDPSTYLKKEKVATDTRIPQDYPNTGIGHDNLLENKQYLVHWVRRVVQDAEKRGKVLLAFSHYPMVDFTNGATREIDNLLIAGQMQLKRVPEEKVAEMFADAGLKLHFGGHMHMNDTGVTTTEKGNTLINVQAPSLAAYKPAYKLLTIREKEVMDVETVTLDSVPDFNEFFDLYEQEHGYLQSIGAKNIWDQNILASKNYHEFTTFHLRELVRLRFLPSEWPSDFASFLLNVSGKELLILSQSVSEESLGDALEKIRADSGETSILWTEARKRAAKSNLTLDHFGDWSGGDLVFDLYRLRSADELAFKDIGTERLNQYRLIMESFLEQRHSVEDKDLTKTNMLVLMELFRKFMNGEPSDHFRMDLNSGKVTRLKD